MKVGLDQGTTTFLQEPSFHCISLNAGGSLDPKRRANGMGEMGEMGES